MTRPQPQPIVASLSAVLAMLAMLLIVPTVAGAQDLFGENGPAPAVNEPAANEPVDNHADSNAPATNEAVPDQPATNEPDGSGTVAAGDSAPPAGGTTERPAGAGAAEFDHALPRTTADGLPTWLVDPAHSPDGVWFFIIATILAFAVGIDWKRPISMRSLDVLMLLAPFPMVLVLGGQDGSAPVAWGGMVAVTAYFLVRLMLDGYRDRRPDASYAPVPALLLLLLVALAWHGFIIARGPVGDSGRHACMGASLLIETGRLPYSEAVMGDEPHLGPLTYFAVAPIEMALPASATLAEGKQVRLVPFDAGTRAEHGLNPSGSISWMAPAELPADATQTEFPAARIVAGAGVLLVVVALIALGAQIGGAGAGFTLAVIVSLNPLIVQGLLHDLTVLPVAFILLALVFRHSATMAALMLGLACSFAVWPVLLLPLFLGWYLRNDFRKGFMWLAVALCAWGFVAMVSVDPSGNVPWPLIGLTVFIMGVATAASTILYSGHLKQKWAMFVLASAAMLFVTVFLIPLFSGDRGILSPQAFDGGIDVWKALTDFTQTTVVRQFTQVAPTAADGVLPARLELVFALVVLCGVLSFVPDRPTAGSLITLTGVALLGSQLWLVSPDGGASPWWLAVALPALVLPLPRRARDTLPGWEPDPDKLARQLAAAAAADQGAHSAHIGDGVPVSPAGVSVPDAPPPVPVSPPPVGAPGMLSQYAMDGAPGGDYRRAGESGRGEALLPPPPPGAEGGMTVQPPPPPRPRRGNTRKLGPDQLSKTTDIVETLKDELDLQDDAMPQDALNAALQARVSGPPTQVGGAELPSDTLSDELVSPSHLLIPGKDDKTRHDMKTGGTTRPVPPPMDEPRVITTPPQAETEVDDDAHLSATMDGNRRPQSDDRFAPFVPEDETAQTLKGDRDIPPIQSGLMSGAVDDEHESRLEIEPPPAPAPPPPPPPGKPGSSDDLITRGDEGF